MQLEDFQFDLSPDLIARYPLVERTSSRLLSLESPKQFMHRHFKDIISLIEPGDLLIFNDTKVIPARLRGHKKTGGQVEILVERILDHECILAQIRVSKKPRLGDDLIFGSFQLKVVEKQDQFYRLRYLNATKPHTVLQVIESIGEIPLPPYLKRSPDAVDSIRYQTVYAKHQGSVAAPTAGLHFDDALLALLKDKGVHFGYLTLHIGAGTFSPVRVENIKDHVMHAEYIEVSETLCEQIRATKACGKRVIAVGTTSLRALETISQRGVPLPFCGETRIFIYPGYQFQCVDVLITNLHLPGSTLLMLVCALGGQARVMAAYQEAVKLGYRFYSYGDAMWVPRV